MTDEDAQPGEPMVDGPLVNGIPALGPGEIRRITWGQFGGLTKALGNASIEVTTRFKGSGSRDLPPVVSHLDVKSFATTSIAERDPTLRLVGEVKRLREAIESLKGVVSLVLDRIGPERGSGGKSNSG